MRRIVPLLLLAVLLTGCKVKIEQGIELKENGSGTATIILGFDEELVQLLDSASPGGDPFSEMTTDLPPGWDSKDWSEGEFTGIETSVAFADLAELRSVVNSTFVGEDGLLESFEIQENADGGFTLAAVISGANLEDGLQGMEGFDIGGSIGDLSESFFVAEISAKLPGTVVNHNADSEQGDGTLVWNVGLADSGRTISATSEPGGGLPLIPLAAAGLVLVLGIVGFAVWRRRSSPVGVTVEEYLPVPPTLEHTAPVDGDPFA